MDDKKQFSRRLLAIGALFSLVLAEYFVTLFDAQIVHGAEYRARSIRANTKSETVVTSRGILTDRNGKALVTNRSVYTLELDASLAPSDDAALNKELLRLIELLENRGIVWEDTLPLTAGAPFAYDFSVSGSHTALNSYLVSKKWADEDTLTTDTDPPLSPEALLSRLRTEFKVDGELTDTEARKLVGLRYCLAVTELNQLSTAAIASDISVELIAELKDPAIMETIKGMIPVPMQEMAPGQYALSPDANTTIYFGLNDNTFYATTDSDALVFLTGAQTSAYEAEVGKLFRGSYGTMFVDFPAVRSLIESLIAQNRLDQSAAASLMALS